MKLKTETMQIMNTTTNHTTKLIMAKMVSRKNYTINRTTTSRLRKWNSSTKLMSKQLVRPEWKKETLTNF